MKKKISKDDWGRKQWVNQIIQAFGILAVAIGAKHQYIFGGWKGIFSVIMGLLILMYQQHFLFKLIEENQNE